ncbi:MAG: VIT family protein [Planctomycetota bacterium]
MLLVHQPERHFSDRISWLRAAVLGANDGIISTASLIIGVAAAGSSNESILIAGFAGLVAGATSMAAGEYVSVSSQSDLEQADLQRERIELETDPESEHLELANIYVERGLTPKLAHEVATQLTEHDALGAHARDELGLLSIHAARPLLAAVASAITFTLGASLPLAIAYFAPFAQAQLFVAASSLVFLAALGCAAAHAGGAKMLVAAVRVTFWGALAMAITFGIGSLIDRVV